ncbi:formate/nitrite transporter family protein [Methyloceanibacter sp.]|uniref:formate/nitrite transporter family protein n=1 Tax=Methyloceanibacter sp. TaxID=1965321 RepID=UPI003D6D492F
MTIDQTVAYFAAQARVKSDMLARRPLAFFISSMMAGAYVGAGILLIFSIGQPLDPSVRSLVMGASFGIALTLVVFAGSELFTGYTMYMALGRLCGTTTLPELTKTWLATWLGNLFGSALLAALFVMGGGGQVLKEGADLLFHVAAYKIASGPVALVCRGALCNWLVCLALWTGARTKDDTAKCILFFWCLFAFIASGFEHSVANMTIFSVALLSANSEAITISGAAYNLLWASIGNAIGGTVFMALGYWAVAERSSERAENAVVVSE